VSPWSVGVGLSSSEEKLIKEMSMVDNESPSFISSSLTGGALASRLCPQTSHPNISMKQRYFHPSAGACG